MPAIDSTTDGFLPVMWEPVINTGERIAVGALVQFRREIIAHRIIRDDVLTCIYGKSAPGARNLIDFALNDLKLIAQHRGINAFEQEAHNGFIAGRFHATQPTSVEEALRTAALMYSSMVALDKLDDLETEDNPLPEEVNKQFTTEVREYVVPRRPDLEEYFGRTATLIEGGNPVKFGICTPRAIMHFGSLHAVRQSAGVRDARARLWELHRAREFTGLSLAGLVMATPREDDVTLTSRQKSSLASHLREIEREADSYQMRFFPVHTVPAAGDTVIRYAG